MRSTSRVAVIALSMVAGLLPAQSGLSVPVASAGSPRIDIEFAFDTTGSMASALADAKTEAMRTVAEVKQRLPGAAFAVVEFGDVEDGIHEYRVVRSVTSSARNVQTAIESLTAHYGGDAPEAHNLVFRNSYARSPILPSSTIATGDVEVRVTDGQPAPNPNVGGDDEEAAMDGVAAAADIGWRTGSTKLVILLTDDVPHGNLQAQGFAGCADQSADPHGLNTRNEVRRMENAERKLYFVSYNDSVRSCLNSIARAAGGRAIRHGESLMDDITSLITSRVTCSPGARSERTRIYVGDRVECRFLAGAGAKFLGWTATRLTPVVSVRKSQAFTARRSGTGSITARYRVGRGVREARFSYRIVKAPTPVAAFTATWLRDTNTIAFDASGSKNATSYTWDFGDPNDGAEGHGKKPSHPYGKAAEFKVTLTVTSIRGDEDKVTHVVAVDPITLYAPRVYLHPDEQYRPSSFDWYLERADLLWARDALSPCPPTFVASAPLDAYSLGSGGYWARSTRNVAGDPLLVCEENGDVYRTNQSTYPGDSSSAVTDDHGEGFYLDVPTSAYEGDDPSNAPVYYEYVAGRYIVYWFFYPYNDFADGGIAGLHESDLEHIAVRLSDQGAMDRLAYWQHECGPVQKARPTKTDPWGDDSGLDGTHPIVYSGLGSHASLWTRSKEHIGLNKCALRDLGGLGRGKVWKTWAAGGMLDLKDGSLPWVGYRGAWGGFGDGTLGPGVFPAFGARTPDFEPPGGW